MNPVFDVLHADSLEIILPANSEALRYTHATMDETFKALCASIHIELIHYHVANRMKLPDGRIKITVMGKACAENRVARR